MDQYGNPFPQHTGGGAPIDSGYGQGGAVRGPEKKGLMEKVKEHIPGGKKTEGERLHQAATGTTGTGTNTATHGYGQGGAVHEPAKKGLMEKVREQIPVGHKMEGERRHQAATGTTGTGPGGLPVSTGTTGTGPGGLPVSTGTTGTGTGGLPVSTGTTGTGTNTGAHGIGQGGAVHEPGKKGLMEKVKENIPCGIKTQQHGHPVAPGTTGTGTGGLPVSNGTTGTGTNTGAHGVGQVGAVYPPEKKGMMQKIKEKLPGQV